MKWNGNLRGGELDFQQVKKFVENLLQTKTNNKVLFKPKSKLNAEALKTPIHTLNNINQM